MIIVIRENNLHRNFQRQILLSNYVLILGQGLIQNKENNKNDLLKFSGKI
jgi:hypothetical protein